MRDTGVGRVWLVVAVSLPLCLLMQWTAMGTSAASESATVPPGSQYAAMGSSYAAGFGIQPLEPGAGACGRSLIDYPHLVAAKLHLQLNDLSCGGAVIANALRKPQGSNPPQIEAVTSKTRLVTMTIGGNDVGYIATAIACGQPNSTCAATANQAQINAAFKALPGALTKLIQAVRTRAPSATIVLVTYPRLVPPTPCPALHYTAAAARLVGSMGSRLEQVFVTVAKADHVRLADPYVLGATHGPCATGTNKWVAGLVPSNGFEYHPTAAGHQEMAQLVEGALGSS
jgi:lysophospholipase L1-like esterase